VRRRDGVLRAGDHRDAAAEVGQYRTECDPRAGRARQAGGARDRSHHRAARRAAGAHGVLEVRLGDRVPGRLTLDWRRPLIYTHRWLGIAGGILFIVWFVPCSVMMYARMPEITIDERRARLTPLDTDKLHVSIADAAREAAACGTGGA